MLEAGDSAKVDLDSLFTVAHIEVVQHISADTLKILMRDLTERVDCLQAAPKAQALESSIYALSNEVESLRSAHSESLHRLEAQQVMPQSYVFLTYVTDYSGKPYKQALLIYVSSLQVELCSVLERLQTSEAERQEVVPDQQMLSSVWSFASYCKEPDFVCLNRQ